MRTTSQTWSAGPILSMASNVWRRRNWFLDGASRHQLANLASSAASFAGHRGTSGPFPVLLKLDLGPMCNLRCTFCVHADPGPGSAPALHEQVFTSRQRISLDQVRVLANEIGRHSMVAALYYVGDPLTHPDLDRICAAFAHVGMRTHVSSNYSFVLSDQRIETLVRSGLSHLTVCLDGADQVSYERTRVGGRLDVVVDNLERTVHARRRAGTRWPFIEVQFIRFQHNEHQLEEIRMLARRLGVDQVTSYWGNLDNYTDLRTSGDGLEPRGRGLLPGARGPGSR